MEPLSSDFSSLQEERRKCSLPQIPIFRERAISIELGEATNSVADQEKIQALFPKCYGKPLAKFCQSGAGSIAVDLSAQKSPLRVGVVLSGGQAAGGHNVICGLYDRLISIHPNSEVIGFKDGPKGVFTNSWMPITADVVDLYRNQGGFDMIGSGRDKIESPEQFASSLSVCEELKLDGLVIIGGDDSNTNACLLGEYFIANNARTTVIGAPKTIDGDLKFKDIIEMSFGFDTATKTYSELISNVMSDTKSTEKYYHFVRLMGRSASHITLECALQTGPNVALIGEEVQERNQSVASIVQELCDVICSRSKLGKDYGIVLVPEGLVEFIPEVKVLIQELNEILAGYTGSVVEADVVAKLSPENAHAFRAMPSALRRQLLLDRDPHGNVMVSRIETEQLLILACKEELERRRKCGEYNGSFKTHAHFFGYEGRSCLPSSLDSTYCYALGQTAGTLLLASVGTGKFAGYIATVGNIRDPNVNNWTCGGAPLTMMMNVERRKGKDKPVICKALVELDSRIFNIYKGIREHWAIGDFYRTSGPIQFHTDLSGHIQRNYTIEYANYYDVRDENIEEFHQEKFYKGFSETEGVLHPSRAHDTHGLPTVLTNVKVAHPAVFDQAAQGLVRATVASCVPHLPNGSIFNAELKESFPNTGLEPPVHITASVDPLPVKSKRIGIVMCGRQAPTVHAALAGVVETYSSHQYFVFPMGVSSLLSGEHFEYDGTGHRLYQYIGGCELLGRSTSKLSSATDLQAAAGTVEKLGLDGVILMGGTETVQHGAKLAEYFRMRGMYTVVNMIPLTVAGDLSVSGSLIEATCGFDTAARTYSQLVGNIAIDGRSAKKYYYFIRLMGRQHSHLVVEAALQVRPNVVLIGEEIAAKRLTLREVVNNVCDAVVKRFNDAGKDYGVIILPEGLVSYIPDVSILMKELDAITASLSPSELATRSDEVRSSVVGQLTAWSQALLDSLPTDFRDEIIFSERESHGSVRLADVESEKLLISCIESELAKRHAAGTYNGKFTAHPQYFGYQARSAMPTRFDASFGYTLGATAAVLTSEGVTGMMANVQGLTLRPSQWACSGLPMAQLMKPEEYDTLTTDGPCADFGQPVSVDSEVYKLVAKYRDSWVMSDAYRNPGPAQVTPITDECEDQRAVASNYTLIAGHKRRHQLMESVRQDCTEVVRAAESGLMSEGELYMTSSHLSALKDTLGNRLKSASNI